MTSRAASIVVALALLATSTACSRAAALADEVGRAVGASSDDVLRQADQEATSSGRSVDEVLERWRREVTVPRQGAARYDDVPPEVRSVACDTVTDVLGDALDADAGTDPAPLVSLAESVAGLNQTVGARALATDLSAAARDLEQGRPATLALITLKVTTCQLLAP